MLMVLRLVSLDLPLLLNAVGWGLNNDGLGSRGDAILLRWSLLPWRSLVPDEVDLRLGGWSGEIDDAFAVFGGRVVKSSLAPVDKSTEPKKE